MPLQEGQHSSGILRRIRSSWRSPLRGSAERTAFVPLRCAKGFAFPDECTKQKAQLNVVLLLGTLIGNRTRTCGSGGHRSIRYTMSARIFSFRLPDYFTRFWKLCQGNAGGRAGNSPRVYRFFQNRGRPRGNSRFFPINRMRVRRLFDKKITIRN